MVLSEQLRSPVRLQRSAFSPVKPYPRNAVYVGQGSRWANPFKKPDVDALRGEPDVDVAYRLGGWREAAKLLYIDHMREAGLDFEQLRGMDLICTCKPDEPCHADVLLELANLD